MPVACESRLGRVQAEGIELEQPPCSVRMIVLPASLSENCQRVVRSLRGLPSADRYLRAVSGILARGPKSEPRERRFYPPAQHLGTGKKKPSWNPGNPPPSPYAVNESAGAGQPQPKELMSTTRTRRRVAHWSEQS